MSQNCQYTLYNTQSFIIGTLYEIQNQSKIFEILTTCSNFDAPIIFEIFKKKIQLFENALAIYDL